MVERLDVAQEVAGSSPVSHPSGIVKVGELRQAVTLLTQRVLGGSNPSSRTHDQAPLAEWIQRLTTDEEIGSSSLSWGATPLLGDPEQDRLDHLGREL